MMGPRTSRQSTPLDDFLKRYGKDAERELLDGMPVERMPVQMEHETLRVWLERLLKDFNATMKRGVLLDASTPVALNDRRARRPDISFLTEECREMLKNGVVYGAPDLVIEIVSSYDMASEVTARENDYRTVGVPEIVFLDPVKRTARILRLRGREYETEQLLDAGSVQLAMLCGISIPMGALMREPRPPLNEMLQRLLNP